MMTYNTTAFLKAKEELEKWNILMWNINQASKP
jgi:hypothetical protein